jgi:hypothetical protein
MYRRWLVTLAVATLLSVVNLALHAFTDSPVDLGAAPLAVSLLVGAMSVIARFIYKGTWLR